MSSIKQNVLHICSSFEILNTVNKPPPEKKNQDLKFQNGRMIKLDFENLVCYKRYVIVIEIKSTIV